MLRVLEYTPVNDFPSRKKKMEQVRYELAAQQEDKPKNEKLQRAKNILSTVVLLAVSGVASSVLGYFFYHLDTPGGAIILFNMRIRFLPSRHLEWRHAKGWTLLDGNLGTNFPRNVHHDVYSKNASFMRVRWTNHAELATDWWKAPEGVQCYQFRWRAPTCVHSALEDCYSLEGAYWYGGGMRGEEWTLERESIRMAPFLTGNLSAEQPYGRILNRYWVSSKGVGIFVEPDSPLWVSINSSGDNRLCLKAAYEHGPYWQPSAQAPVHLNYTMCSAPNLRAVHWYMTQTFFNVSQTPPTERNLKLVTNPTWFLSPSETTEGKKSVSDVLKTISDIQMLHENFTQCKLVLRIESLTSELPPNSSPGIFSKTNVTSVRIRELVKHLYSIGFSDISLVISPTDYLNINLRKDYVVLNSGPHTIPPRIRWETTENQLQRTTARWFKLVVERLGKDLNVSSFVFRGGQALSLPFHDVLIKGLRSPDYFTSMYQTLALRHDPDALFDSASGSRMNLSSFLIMRERDWRFDGRGGLSGIIPEALTLGLVGFPYIMAPSLSWTPSLEESLNDPANPDRGRLENIYLRWLQIVAFFPSISFSISPVAFGENVTQTVEDILALRSGQNYRLLNLARTVHRKRVPIVRPVWWIAPGDRQAQPIDDQYLVGNNLLVAPLLQLYACSRSIYLPRGEWQDMLRNETYVGPLWLYDYAVALSEVAHFVLL